MRIELNTNDESRAGMRHLAALLLALAGEDVPRATPQPLNPAGYTAGGEGGGTIVDLTPQATVGNNGASSEPAQSPAGDPAGDEAGAEAGAGTPADDAPATTVQKRTRRTKAEMEAARAGEAGNAGAGAADTPSTTASETSSQESGQSVTAAPSNASASDKSLTLDDVRAALQRYTEKTSVQHAIVLLKNYGASRISELEAGQYSLFIAECDAKE